MSTKSQYSGAASKTINYSDKQSNAVSFKSPTAKSQKSGNTYLSKTALNDYDKRRQSNQSKRPLSSAKSGVTSKNKLASRKSAEGSTRSSLFTTVKFKRLGGRKLVDF